ncbi:MAG: response regulator [Nitrospiraceae bacterium]|nr:response regulator [Nitrospiraceae bacterium]
MDFDRKKILVADDSKTFLMYTTLLVKRMGFNPISAENGIEAIKIMTSMLPDAVMLDVHMPVLDGIKTLNHIKSDLRTSNIPVIMISVEYDEDTIAKCKKFGCNDYLTKPLKIKQLHSTLQNCLFSSEGKPRKHIRVSFNEKVIIKHNNNKFDFESENLSERGIFLSGKEHLPVGSHVQVNFPIKDMDALSLDGIVIYTKSLSGQNPSRIPRGMAIEFKEPNIDAAAILKNHVTKLLADDILQNQEEPFFDAG